jgi:hypothetical protein
VIPFRTQRLATSVTNRILAIHAGLPPRAEAGAPNAPEPLGEGADVQARINAPKAPADADPATAAGIALEPLASK